MAAIRALVLFFALAGFFLIGAPLQWLAVRHAPAVAHRIPLFFCRSILQLLRVRLTIVGRRITNGPVLLVANHLSWIDILALGGITPFCFLAKREVSAWPILSAFAEVQGTVFVDRARRRSIPGANRNMAARLLEGRSVLLFPEGTTRAESEPGPFLTSHFAAARDLLRMSSAHERVAVQPVAIGYSSPAAAWVGDDGLLPHLWRTLRAPPLDCLVAFGAPLSFDAMSDRKLIARATRETIIALLNQHPARQCERFAADFDAAAVPSPR